MNIPGKLILRSISAIVLLSGSLTSTAQVQITYLANEGVIIEGGGGKVLIDPFFKVGFGLYQTLPIGDMETFSAQHPELNNAAALLVSHRHADHIDPGFVAAYMKANPDTKLVSSAQASDSVVNQFGVPRERVVNVLPKMNQEIVPVRVGNVEFKAAWMRHGNQRNFDVVNLCFITNIGGKKILHLGDSEIHPSSFGQVDFAREEIDLLLAPYWWLMPEYGGPDIIKDRIKPKKIVAFHVSNDFGKIKEEILRVFPAVIFFDKPFSVIRLD